MSDHQRGSKKDEFCAVAGTPCECGNDYVENSKVSSWASHSFRRLVRLQTGSFTFDKQFEAHHLLCISSVSSEIVSVPSIDGIVRNTTWCINAEANMYPMPLWGHT